MEEKGFYKLTKKGVLLHAGEYLDLTFVQLTESNHNLYQLPIKGWRWFNTEYAAMTYYMQHDKRVSSRIC